MQIEVKDYGLHHPYWKKTAQANQGTFTNGLQCILTGLALHLTWAHLSNSGSKKVLEK